MVVESPLYDHTEFFLSAYTHPGEGSLLRRFFEDLRRFRKALKGHPEHATVMMQVGQYRSIYREWALGRLARRARRRLVLDVRAGAVLEFLEEHANALERRLFRGLMERSDLALVQCQSFLPELRRRYPETTFAWFPNFVPAARSAESSVLSYSRGERLKLVYFGHYIPQKGLLEMVEAVRRCRCDRGLDVELHLAGGGTHAGIGKAIAAAEKAGVIDHGRLRPRDLWKLLGEVHALLYPTSHWGEGHTNAVNEALMSGLVIVATPHNELPRILPEAGTLWLDRDCLVDSLAERIEFLVENPDFVNRAARSNREFLLQNYADTRWIPYLEERLDSLREEAFR
jgi:glycosyltransferase involved in cell wall biosynthesis